MSLNKEILDKIKKLGEDAGFESEALNEALGREESEEETSGEQDSSEQPVEKSEAEQLKDFKALSRAIQIAQAGFDDRHGFLKTPSFFSSLNYFLKNPTTWMLNPSLDSDVIRMNSELKPSEGVASMNSNAERVFNKFISDKSRDFRRFFGPLKDILAASGIELQDIDSSIEGDEIEDLYVKYRTSREKGGILDPMSSLNVISEITKYINKMCENVISYLSEYLSGDPDERADAILSDIDNGITDHLSSIYTNLSILDRVVGKFQSSQSFKKDLRKERRREFAPTTSDNDATSTSARPTSSRPSSDETDPREFFSSLQVSFSRIDASRSEGLSAGEQDDENNVVYSILQNADSAKIFLLINSNKKIPENLLPILAKPISRRLVSSGEMLLSQSLDFEGGASVELMEADVTENGVNQYYLILNLLPALIRSLNSGDGVFRFPDRSGESSSIVSFAEENFDRLTKLAESQTTVYYETVDPDGNTVYFTPSDLVRGGGKLKSKGKSFKPKKMKGKSLSSIVNSKSFGKIKRR